MNSGEYLCIIILCIILLIIFLYLRREYNDITYVKSDIDGQLYLVRNLLDKQQSANLLATIKKNMFKLANYLNDNKDKFKDFISYIEQLNNNIKNVSLMESSENSIYTSYSVNKGEEIVFCLRSRTNKNKLHDINLIMYVVLHEMSHVACPEYGHGDLFKKIFAFIATQAIQIGLYKKIDFFTQPTEYCGMMVTDSII
jgi:predicted metal-dependent hydrolase